MSIRAAFSSLTIASVLIALLLPIIASAQSQEDLKATIRASLLSDPRAAAIPAEEFEALIDSLTAQADVEGITIHDIMWQPEETSEEFAANSAIGPCDSGSILCRLNVAFGFAGDDYTIAIWLGICSAILILVLGALMEIHHLQHKKQMLAQQSSPPQQ